MFPFTVIKSTDTEALHGIRIQVWQSLTPEELPDTDIAIPTRLGAATLEIFELLGYTQAKFDALAEDSLERHRIILAVQFRTAAIIVPTLPQQTRESILNQAHDEQHAVIDWELKEQKLNEDAINWLGDLVPEDSVLGGGSAAVFATFEVPTHI